MLHVLPLKYTVALNITAVNAGNSPKLAGLAGLAGIAGISLPSDAEGGFDMFLRNVHSDALAQRLISRKPEVARAVFVREWNVQQGHWQQPTDNLRGLKNLVKVILGMPRRAWQPPNSDKMREFVEKNVVVTREKKEPAAQLTIETEDPHMGVILLHNLHSELDRLLQERSVQRTSAYIAYLENKIPTVTIEKQRNALYDILSEQEKLRMIASASTAFSAESFGKPYILPKPTSPRIPLVIGLGVMASFVVAILCAIFFRQRSAFL
jgi:hypothetical protein